MKKIVSMLLVLSLLLAFAVTGTTTVSADDIPDGHICAVRNASMPNYEKNYQVYFFTDDPANFIEIEDGTSASFKVWAARNFKIRVYYGSGIEDDGDAFKVVASGTKANIANQTFTKTTDGWETFTVTFNQKSAIKMNEINYVAIAGSKGTGSSINKFFILEDEDPLKCLNMSSHKHNWSTEYSRNENSHWHECLEPNCPIVDDRGKDGYQGHRYDADNRLDKDCNVCGYEKPADPDYQFFVNPSNSKFTYHMKWLGNQEASSYFTTKAIGEMKYTDTDKAYVFKTSEDNKKGYGFYIARNTNDYIEYILAEYEDMYVVSGWIYISDADNQDVAMRLIVTDGTVNLNTKSWAYQYNFKGMEGLVDGWNFVKIPLSDFIKGCDATDDADAVEAYNILKSKDKLAAVSFIDNNEENYGKYTLAIGSLAIGFVPYTDAKTPESQDPFYGENESDDSGKEPGGETEDDSEKEPQKPKRPNTFFISSDEVEALPENGAPSVTAGNESVWYPVKIGGNTGEAFCGLNITGGVFTIQHKSINASAKQGDKAFFYFFISDVNNIKEFQWEVGSSNDCTGNCIRYVMKTDMVRQELKTGWNKINFELVDSKNLESQKYDYGRFSDYYGVGLGGGMTGNVNYSKINYFRIVVHTVSSQTAVNAGCFNLQFGASTSMGDTTPVVSIAIITLVAAILAGGVFYYNKKRTVK